MSSKCLCDEISQTHVKIARLSLSSVVMQLCRVMSLQSACALPVGNERNHFLFNERYVVITCRHLGMRKVMQGEGQLHSTYNMSMHHLSICSVAVATE